MRLLVWLAVCAVACAQEIPADSALVAAYQAVFAVTGGAVVVSDGPPVAYVEDRLRVLLGVQSGASLDLAAVRGLDQPDLLVLLFKAVAGDYITGPNALRSDVCRLIADPASGVVGVTRDGEDDEPVLIVISVVLLCVLVVMMYRRDTVRP